MNDTQAQARPKRPALEEVEAYVRGKGYDDRGSANAFYGNFFYAYHDARAWRRADGTPVLRMYEYERLRGVSFQMDFFLPDGSRVLFARMRLVNENAQTVPTYWWSNIAVPEWRGGGPSRPRSDARYTSAAPARSSRNGRPPSDCSPGRSRRRRRGRPARCP